MTKKEARKYVQSMKADLTPEEIASRSRQIMNRLKQCEVFLRTENILTYVSYNQEVDTHALIKDCLLMGKKVYVPKVCGKQMDFHQITSFQMLRPGTYGILEPDNEMQPEWDSLCGLMIMPGLAFDRQLHRVGYGGGFYDRYLCGRSGIVKAAVCFDFQVLRQIETEPHDLKPDLLICEHEILGELNPHCFT